MEIAKYGQLPPLPSKTLPFFGADSGAVNQRTVELGQILVKLSARADTRQSEPFRSFINFDSHTSFSVSLRELGRGRTSIDPRFGLIGIGTTGDYMVAVHSDTTSLSRLGKVWSIVEADELAQLTIWKLSRGFHPETIDDELGDALPVGEKIYARTLPEKVHTFKMIRDGKLVCGMPSGNIQIFDISNPAKPFLSIAAHGNSPVVAVDLLTDETLISVSLDSTLRISSVSSGNLLGGGKMTRRLAENEIFRCMHVQAASGRVLLGTDKGRVFILDVSSGSPSFLHVLTLNTLPVYCISTAGDTLLVGAGITLSKYNLPMKGKEGAEMKRIFQISTYNKAKVKSCMVLPGSDLIVAGLGDGAVAIYNNQAVVYSRAFAFEFVNVLHYDDGTLWVGSDDGRIVEVIIPSTVHEDAEYSLSFITMAEEESKPLNPSPRLGDLSALNANSSCLKKSSALADDDSDDDWRKDLFRN